MRWRRPLWPRRLASQVAACVILTPLVSQLLTIWLVATPEHPFEPPPVFVAADHVALLIAMLDIVPAADRPGVAARLRQPYLHISTETGDVLQGPDSAGLQEFRRFLQARLGNRFVLKLAGSDPLGLPQRVIIDAWLSDGATVRVVAETLGSWGVFLFSLKQFYLPGSIVALAIVMLWATRRITAPLRAFSDAAERLGNERSAPPLPESGPLELRRAARSFNKMQEQVKRFIEDRTKTLAAISHDLRTPITRLRLRVEAAVESEEEQRKMLRDLDQMDAMISSALSFLRDGAYNEPVVNVDLGSLLQSECDEFTDLGHDVCYVGAARLSVNCRPKLIARAMANLLENATKYGTTSTVDLRPEGGNAVIHIDDDGPGIPDAEKEKAFDPFCRLDAARGSEAGGFGLGLSIAKTIVELHGGQIKLADHPPSGTRVVVKLPIVQKVGSGSFIAQRSSVRLDPNNPAENRTWSD